MSKLSVMYNYVRSRQLEGTFPGDPKTGCWPITSLRVSRGWGCPPAAEWPYEGKAEHWPPQAEPQNIDTIARKNRLFAYQRVRTCNECKIAISRGYAVLFAAEITNSWFHAPYGVISMPGPNDKIIGSHCVSLYGYDDNQGIFKFANSWGTDWGDKGYGYLPYDFIEKFVVECWILLPYHDEYQRRGGDSILNWGIPSLLHSHVHGVEIRDGITDDYKAWAFGVPYEGFLNVEELFVMPAYRGKGLAKALISDLEMLSNVLSKPLRFWVPFADSSQSNMQIVRHLANIYGYKIALVAVRWASHIMAPEVPKGVNKRPGSIPGIVSPDTIGISLPLIPMATRMKNNDFSIA